MKLKLSLLTSALLCSSMTNVAQAWNHYDYFSPKLPNVIVGNDLNSAESADPIIQQLFSANRGSNGGGDQSLQFFDNLKGTYINDVLIGGLGADNLFGSWGNDIMIGGTEDFNSFPRTDRAYGQFGHDLFMWAPGDGNDFFDGGKGIDVLALGPIGEIRDNDGSEPGFPVFNVSPPGTPGSGDFDGIFLNEYNQPVMNVTGSPGFCSVVESQDYPQAFDALDLDHVVRFTLRGFANSFGVEQEADDGLRIAISVKNVEYLVCASRAGGEIEVLDLTTSPPSPAALEDLPANIADIFI